jgi:hypothetical protein
VAVGVAVGVAVWVAALVLMGVAVGVAVGSEPGVPVVVGAAGGGRVVVLATVAVGVAIGGGAGQLEQDSRTSSTHALSPALSSHITSTLPATVLAGATKVAVSGTQSDVPVSRGVCQTVVTGLV